MIEDKNNIKGKMIFHTMNWYFKITEHIFAPKRAIEIH